MDFIKGLGVSESGSNFSANSLQLCEYYRLVAHGTNPFDQLQICESANGDNTAPLLLMF